MSSLPAFSFDPLPFHVPLEVKHHILKFCDPSTLAKMARVSFAFLELISPLLYRNVNIQGLWQLQWLFCEREESQPTVASFLSLSQIEIFRFTVLPDDTYFRYVERTNRIPLSGYLAVRLLVVTEDEERWERKEGYLSLLPLYERFQPAGVELRTVPYQQRTRPSKIEYTSIYGLKVGRLRSMAFVNVVPSGPLRPSFDEEMGIWEEEDELDPSLPPLGIVLRCTSTVTSRVFSWLDAVHNHLREWSKDWEEVVRLEVRVSSSEMAELAKEKLVAARGWAKMEINVVKSPSQPVASSA